MLKLKWIVYSQLANRSEVEGKKSDIIEDSAVEYHHIFWNCIKINKFLFSVNINTFDWHLKPI